MCTFDTSSLFQDLLATTDEYPETLSTTISSIRNSLATRTSSSVADIITSQEKLSASMESHLESLAAHYDQMAGALRESEAGEIFSEEDLQGWFPDCRTVLISILTVARYESLYK